MASEQHLPNNGKLSVHTPLKHMRSGGKAPCTLNLSARQVSDHFQATEFLTPGKQVFISSEQEVEWIPETV